MNTTTTATATDIRRAEGAYNDAGHAIAEAMEALGEAYRAMKDITTDEDTLGDLLEVVNALHAAQGKLGNAESRFWLSA